MKNLVLLFILTAVACSASEPSDRILRLDVMIYRESHPRKVDGSTADTYIRATLTNIGDQPVTVPTSTYDGQPCCWSTGGDSYEITYVIGVRKLPDGRIAQSSPSRFLPVTLQPGECTELPSYELSSASPKVVGVGFVVEQAFANKQGWWSGSLFADNRWQLKAAEPGATDNPDGARRLREDH